LFIYFIYVAGGGALGASLRFFVQSSSKLYFPNFPVGTLIVNIIGSFLIGLLANYLNSKEISELFYKYFIIIGLLGSFTTFSAFSIETIELFKEGRILLSLIYIFLSFVLTISAAFLGLSLNKF
tara:strand:+ start:91 stop:462 length:372 start_codon:yes stop_codon:yes gene_type:complete